VFTAASRTHRLDTSIEIDAKPARVWSVLTDFANYPRWNPFFRAIDGELEVGKTLDIAVEPPGGRAMKFHPVVLAVEPDRELRWKGKLLIPGLFDGEHWFRLRPSQHGKVVLEHGESFSGILVPRFKPSLDSHTRAGFVAMNEALKREAERRGRHAGEAP
jgi:hypothetical protein